MRRLPDNRMREPRLGTNKAKVLASIRAHPDGVTDTQLGQMTGVGPHQQVNQICRALAQRGLIRRVDAVRPILNVPIESDGDKRQIAAIPRAEPAPAVTHSIAHVRERQSQSTAARLSFDPTNTLVVLTCSKAKAPGGVPGGNDGLAALLPTDLAGELRAARQRIAVAAHLDDSRLEPAWRRYTGFFYAEAGEGLAEAVAATPHILILSGGYGVLTARERIGYYDRIFKPGDWPDRLVQRILEHYVQASDLSRVAAFAGASTPYAQALRRVRWPASVEMATLIAADFHGGGAQRAVPEANGGAFTAYVDGRFTPGWRTSADVGFELEPL